MTEMATVFTYNSMEHTSNCSGAGTIDYSSVSGSVTMQRIVQAQS